MASLGIGSIAVKYIMEVSFLAVAIMTSTNIVNTQATLS